MSGSSGPKGGQPSANLQREAKGLDLPTRELMAFVTHELKSPLHAIASWLEVVKRAPPGSDQFLRAVAGVERGIAAQTQLLARLANLSGMVSGNLRIELRPLDAAALVSEAVESLRVEAELGRRCVEFEPCDGDAPIVGDADWLRQALGNLFDNAIKFTPAQGRIGVTIRRKDSEVEIRIADSGRGIAADQMDRIFERFYHRDDRDPAADDDLSRLEMGLGLYVVKLIVAAHGGRLSAQSDGVGRGATLIVCLPLASDESADRVAPDAQRTAAE